MIRFVGSANFVFDVMNLHFFPRDYIYKLLILHYHGLIAEKGFTKQIAMVNSQTTINTHISVGGKLA